MIHANKERIKSIALIALFIISLIQVGILWSKQSHRLPISFLAGIFSKPPIEVSDDMARNELFIPYRLIVSSGDRAHWIVERKDPLYQTMWDEVKAYLSGIVRGNITEVAAGPDQWGETTSKRGFVFEFKSQIGSDLLKWFLDNPNSTVDIPAIRKIMIIPDSSNDRISTLYIYDASGKVHRYSPVEYDRKKSFGEILSVFEDENQKTWREYITIYDSNMKLNFAPDALYALGTPTSWPYNVISCSIPAVLRDEDKVGVALLGSQKERYETKKYENGTIQYSIKDHLYRIYPDGVLEFIYSAEADTSVREDVGAALLNAYSLVKKTASLTDSRADIYLSGMALKNGIYTFTFDYMIEGLPVYVNTAGAGSGKGAVNAVTIKANSKRVFSCQFVIRNFSIEGEKNFDDRAIELLSNSNIDRNELQIRDMGVGYVISSALDKELVPHLVLENEKIPALVTKQLPERKGD